MTLATSKGSIWTLETLKELMDERDQRYKGEAAAAQLALATALVSAEKAVSAALAAAKEAVAKAEGASERRFESVNEFRGALTDQSAKMLTRTEAEQRFIAISDALARLERFQAAVTGAQAQQGGADIKKDASNRIILTFVGFAITIVIALAGAAVAIISRLPPAP